MKSVYRDDPQTYWQRREAVLQQRLAQAQEENRVKDECLELAMKALRQYAEFTVFNAQKTVAEIKIHLAQLEEETR